MPAPGTEVIQVESAPPRPSTSDTGQALFVGEAEAGPIGALRARSLAEFVKQRGGRVAYSYLYDAVETALREGCGSIYTARVVSDTAVTAFVDLNDSVPTATMRVQAAGPGNYGNGLAVVVLSHGDDANIPAGYFKLKILEDGVVIEETPSFADKNAAYNWSAAAQRTVVLSDLAGAGVPVSVASPGASLATGADNRGAITNAEVVEALDRLHKDLGPGQVAAPGYTNDTVHAALRDHAKERNRHPLPDAPDTDVLQTVIDSARAIDSGTAGRWSAGPYWPWAVVPGLIPGTTRVVPYSAVQAGLAARVDAQGNPNVPVAGERNGSARWALGLSQDVRALTQDELGELNDAGVNVARIFYQGGPPVTYGNRTVRLLSDDPLWYQASGSRLAMAVAARGDAILRRYVHEQIDGKGRLQAALAGELTGMLGELYEVGALYGETPGDAFAVDTGPAINTPETIARGELHAVVSYRSSPGAELVRLELVRVAITEAVA